MRDDECVRTTLSIDDDVLAAARAIAEARGATIGEVISSLVRRSLSPAVAAAPTRNGIPLLPRREGGGIVTPELVRSLVEDDDR
jgi:hypothetical protein